MTIKLLTTFDVNNKVTKTYTEDIVIEGELKEKCSILSPKILVKLDTFPTSNYAYIVEFKRYYFINDIKVIDDIYELSMSVDVLMTYNTQIKALTCVISRQENKYNLYLPDNAFKAYAYPQVQTKVFPEGFSNANYFLLAVAGNTTNET